MSVISVIPIEHHKTIEEPCKNRAKKGKSSTVISGIIGF
jgi:hypothetical protein